MDELRVAGLVVEVVLLHAPLVPALYCMSYSVAPETAVQLTAMLLWVGVSVTPVTFAKVLWVTTSL